MSDSSPSPRRGLLGGLGPAIITASVVIGPGSILTASRLGHEYGYQMIWVLAAAVALMIGLTALSARLGVVLDDTLCNELARRAGRPIAVLTGLSVFLIASCFQFSNNLGVLLAIEPFFAPESSAIRIGAIVSLNAFIIMALYGFKSLYIPIERLMKLLVALMILAFAGNLLLAKPNVLEVLAGLVPRLPDGAIESIWPRWQPDPANPGQGIVIDHLALVTALIATTASVAGAFYQSYLVRQKGWTRNHLRQGLIDSAVGIGVLGLITLMVMVTAAAVLHGRSGVQLNTAADVALQLEPAFGSGAKVLFCLGIFAGAFSSFLVNAMIGGSMLSDGLGRGGYIDQPWPKAFTVLALMTGMLVAIGITLYGGQFTVGLIIFAQALTVLALPVLSAAMLWLAVQPDLTGDRRVPLWLKLVGAVGLAVSLFLALRLGTKLLLPVIYG